MSGFFSWKEPRANQPFSISANTTPFVSGYVSTQKTFTFTFISSQWRSLVSETFRRSLYKYLLFLSFVTDLAPAPRCRQRDRPCLRKASPRSWTAKKTLDFLFWNLSIPRVPSRIVNANAEFLDVVSWFVSSRLCLAAEPQSLEDASLQGWYLEQWGMDQP